jgi:protein PhnA
MKILPLLQQRCNNECELCSQASDALIAYAVPPKDNNDIDNQVALCPTCATPVLNNNFENTNYWRILTTSIWSETPAVQALSYKILTSIKNESWAIETLESVYLDPEIIDWANAEANLAALQVIHKDAYGVVLASGDTVILTQNLNVKGANFIAPKGTIVRKIKVVGNNAEQIEGKIEGDTIVLLTKFVRKSTV